MKIRITLEIDDEETVENYKDIHPELLFEDLCQHGLMGFVNLVSVENID